MIAHKGKLKLRPVRAHIKREGIVDHVKPFLHIHFKGDDWKSDHKHGHNPEWGHEGHWDHHIHHPQDDIEIKMMDHEGLLNNEPIGHWKDNVGHFTHKEGQHEMEIELKHMGHVAAVVVMHIHFDKE